MVNSEAYRENSGIEVTQAEKHERGEPRRKRAKVESDVDEEVESEAEESEDEAVAEVVDDDEEVSRTSRTIRLRNPRKKAGVGLVARRTRGRGRVENSLQVLVYAYALLVSEASLHHAAVARVSYERHPCPTSVIQRQGYANPNVLRLDAA